MRVAVYARVSTSDRDQDPETQLLPLRDFCTAQEWVLFREYVDQVSASDFAHRHAWRQLLDDAAKRKFSVVLVFKLDRAFPAQPARLPGGIRVGADQRAGQGRDGAGSQTRPSDRPT